MPSVIANSTTSTSQSRRPSAPSSNSRIPHVFVIPPEEEQQDNPPWCCFDADERPEISDGVDVPSTPDIHSFDVPYLFQSSENDIPISIARRTSVHQSRPKAPPSKKLEKKQRPEAIEIIENKPSQARQRDAREDSDVIEIVKVKRTREAVTDLEEGAHAKRSKTLKARATKALKSIKNVGKVSHRTHVKELWTSSESMPGIFKGMQEQENPSIPPKKGSLSRANSRSLSQIFQPAKPSRIESLFTVRIPSSVVLAEAHHVLPAASPSALSHLKDGKMNTSPNPSTLTTDDVPNRSEPSIPSMKNTSINTKFSVRELHRLFSFSSPSPDGPSLPPTAMTAIFSSASSSSQPSTSTFPLSNNYPDVSMEDSYVGADFELESAHRKLASRHPQTFYTRYNDNFSTPRRLSDVSFEMRLDSLHFDALSFDPEDFRVSREGSFLR